MIYKHLTIYIALLTLFSLSWSDKETTIQAMKNYENQYEAIMNNIVNAKTPGYKSVISTVHSKNGKLSTKTEHAMTSGTKVYTGDPYNMAIEGKGYFVVSTGQGTLLTRDGRFKLNKDNQLVTFSGEYPVLGESGTISFELGINGDIKFIVSETGEIFQDKNPVNRFLIVQCDPRDLESINSVFFRATGATTPIEIPRIYQFYQESSNVEITRELIKMPLTTKKYDANSKVLQTLSRANKTGLEMGRSQ